MSLTEHVQPDVLPVAKLPFVSKLAWADAAGASTTASAGHEQQDAPEGWPSPVAGPR